MAKAKRSLDERIKEKEERFNKAQEKAKQYQEQIKQLEKIKKNDDRKKRTHLLCEVGGVVEKVLNRPLVEEDALRLLNFLNKQEKNGKFFTKAMSIGMDTEMEEAETGDEGGS